MGVQLDSYSLHMEVDTAGAAVSLLSEKAYILESISRHSLAGVEGHSRPPQESHSE